MAPDSSFILLKMISPISIGRAREWSASVSAVLLSLLLASIQSAPAESPRSPSLLGDDLVVLGDPDFGMESGIRSVRSLGRLAFLYDEELQRLMTLDEEEPAARALGTFGRLLKLVLVDSFFIQLEFGVTHEVFGHGARGRENGLSPSFQFSLPYPYQWVLDTKVDHGGITLDARSGVLERDLLVLAAGIEANHFGAWSLESEFLIPRGRAHYSEALLYIVSNVYYSDSAFFGRANESADPGDDVHAYVTGLQERFNQWRDEDRSRIERRLQVAWLWIFADPMFWLSFWQVLVDHAVLGERWMNIPMLEIDTIRFFPGTRFNLSPFGAEHYLDLFMLKDDLLIDLYGRIGSSGLASYWGAGIRALGYQPGFGLELGGELDLWNQPEILFEHRNVFLRPNTWGASTALHATWRIYRPIGIIGKLGAKTHGYLMGQPVDAGIYGYVGLSLSSDESALFP
jgi:hypothetical protein